MFERRIMFIGNDTIENGILHRTFQLPHKSTRGKAEDAHNLLTVDRRLEVTYAVLLLYILQFLPHNSEIIQELLLAHLVLGGDICLAQ